MEKNCLYCGTHFTTNRNNKKYCSPNCKQLAYFKRNGMVFSTTQETDNIKYITPLPVKLQNVKYAFPQTIVKDEAKKETVKNVSEMPNVKGIKQSDPIKAISEPDFNEKRMEAMLNGFMASMEQKFNQAIESVKKELNVKYDSLNVKLETTALTESENVKHEIPNVKVKLICNPSTFNGVISNTTEDKAKINYCNACKVLTVKYVTARNSNSDNTQNTKQVNSASSFTLAEIKKNEQQNTAIDKSIYADVLTLTNSQTAKPILSGKEHNEVEKQAMPTQNTHQVKFVLLLDEDELASEEDINTFKSTEKILENSDGSEEGEPENEEEEQEGEEPEIEETDEAENTASSETLRIKQLKHELLELKFKQIEKQNPSQNENEAEHEEEPEHEQIPEPKFKWIESTLQKKVESNYEANNTAYLFTNPVRHWSIDKIISVNWINVRLRCLIESMIKLSNFSRIDGQTLLCLTDAFNKLVRSRAFRNLPENYPNKDFIKELCVKLNALARNTYIEKPKFNLSVELKSRLIALRLQMIKYAPAMRFSEMDFIEKNYFQEEKTEEESERKQKSKNSDWQSRLAAIKNEERRNAA
ncbi:MAG: hypothetical protein H0W61_10240 [Bacteroidetes bacterium]|nr:hypothetical protein [Bacteroidota bacterium]